MNAVRKEAYVETYEKRIHTKKRSIELVKKSKVRNDNKVFIISRAIKKALSLAFLATLFGLLVTLLMGYNQMSEIQREISKNNKAYEGLLAQKDYLAMELEPYTSNERIESIAKSLGMDYPKAEQIVKLNLEETKQITKTSSIKNNDNSFFSLLKRIFY